VHCSRKRKDERKRIRPVGFWGNDLILVSYQRNSRLPNPANNVGIIIKEVMLDLSLSSMVVHAKKDAHLLIVPVGDSYLAAMHRK
jgi:hypothetical protein